MQNKEMDVIGLRNLRPRTGFPAALFVLPLVFVFAGCDDGPRKSYQRGLADYKSEDNAYLAWKRDQFGMGKAIGGAVDDGGDGDYGPANAVDAADGLDLANAGVIKGLVKYGAKAPPAKRIDISKEIYCNQNHQVFKEDLVVGANGELKNCVVYITKGFNRFGDFPVPSEEVTLNQEGCRYLPHVVAMRVGQPLLMTNADPLMHNLKFGGRKNPPFNKNQQKGGRDTVYFGRPEVGASMKCDVHGWMRAPMHFFTHPYFAVTDEAGNFEIKNVPPGRYLIAFAHERSLVTAPIEVEVGPKETKTVEATMAKGG